ncbi:MAG TPA: hypothetical protein VNI36_05920 [Candidatus Dormibacteraeota bacterium]|nr:hypothetical protein [Candidatus Dormibacteraeota bacterium]
MTKRKTPGNSRHQKPADPAEQEGANPRQASFDAFYLNGGPHFSPGNAYKSAIAAGYSPNTAKSNCHVLARRASIKVARALEALGCDGFSQAAKLLELREAKTVRWNQKKEKWDEFEDADVQLRATQEINRLHDSYPAPKEPIEDARPITIVFEGPLSSMMPPAEAKKPKTGEK